MNCAKCGQSIIPASSAVAFRSKSYHQACFAKVKEEAKNKNNKKAALVNDPAQQQLAEYICKLFCLSDLSLMLRKQLDDLHNKHGYSWQNIQLAIRYWFELGEGAEEEPEHLSFGIIPYIYDEAMQFFKDVEAANKFNATFSPQNKTVVFDKENYHIGDRVMVEIYDSSSATLLGKPIS